MGSPFSHCAVLGAECLSSLYPRPLNGNLKSLAELEPTRRIGLPPHLTHPVLTGRMRPSVRTSPMID
jgi:hypothetical protein